MILELGSAMRIPGAPAVSSREPIDEACATTIVVVVVRYWMGDP